jgi:hypothetical protein
MSLTPWERQRDLIALKRLGAEKDLAELEAIPQQYLDADPAFAERVRRLKEAVQNKIAEYLRPQPPTGTAEAWAAARECLVDRPPPELLYFKETLYAPESD